MLKQESFKNLFFNKYKIKKLIYSSDFASVYQGINEKQNIPVAIKLEKRNAQKNLLESEAFLLMILRGYGIPKIITYGHHGLYNVLIEEMLGKSLGYIYDSIWSAKFKMKDICMIALQCLDRLEYIHSKFVIHRDIKPQNFVIGRSDPNTIYLIDFGLSRKYRSSRTGKHIKFNNLKLTYGSLRYLSINGNRGYEQSRRDDLESLGYMLIFLATGKIPWLKQEQLNINIVKKYMLIYKIKKSIDSKTLCKDLPEEFPIYLDYCKNLYFEQEPDYNYLRNLFSTILLKMRLKNDLKFSWISNKIFCKYEKDINNIKNKNYNRKSTSPHFKLLNKIKQSLKEKEKGEQSKNINNCFQIENNNNNIYEIKKIKDFEFKNNNERGLALTENEDKKFKNMTNILESQSSREKVIKGLNIEKSYSKSLNKKEKNRIVEEKKRINNKNLQNKNNSNKMDNPTDDLENIKVKNIQIIDEEQNKYYEFKYQFSSVLDVNEQYKKNIALNEYKDLYEKNAKPQNMKSKNVENKIKDKSQDNAFKKIKFITDNNFWHDDENENIKKRQSIFNTYINVSLNNLISDYNMKNNLINRKGNILKRPNLDINNTINLYNSNKNYAINKLFSNFNFNNNNINNINNRNINFNLANLHKNDNNAKYKRVTIRNEKLNNNRMKNIVNNARNNFNYHFRKEIFDNISYNNSKDELNFKNIFKFNNPSFFKVKHSNYRNDSKNNMNFNSFIINPKLNSFNNNNKRYTNNVISRKNQLDLNFKLRYNNYIQK